jgi:hypothetical protein
MILMRYFRAWPTNEYVNFVINYVKANTALNGHDFTIEGRFSEKGIPNARVQTEFRDRPFVMDVYNSGFFYVRLGTSPPGTCTGLPDLVFYLGRVLA